MGKTYVFDESNLLRAVDAKLASLDMSVLEKAREDLIKDHSDTSIIDKAIKTKKKREKLIEKQRRKKERYEFFTFLNELFKHGPNEPVKHYDYEPYNFEEEELEEDDYHYDDLD